MKNLIKRIMSKEQNPKKRIENLVFLIVILIITLFIINMILKKDNSKIEDTDDEKESVTKVLANTKQNSKAELEENLEEILSTIKNVGRVKVFINYSESSDMIPLYDETTTTSTVIEEDSSGGTRNTEQTETQKDIVFSEKSGNKEAIIQKTIMPKVQGAIITAEGASDANIKTNIINAVQAVTGITIDKIQVFEMK